MSQKCPTLYKYEYLELLTYLNVVVFFKPPSSIYLNLFSPRPIQHRVQHTGPVPADEWLWGHPWCGRFLSVVVQGRSPYYLCMAVWERPVWWCLRAGSTLIVFVSWFPAPWSRQVSTEHSVPSGRQSLSVCTGFAESLSTLTVHMHIITHTHGSVTDRQEHSLSNTEPLWSRSIFFSLKKLVVLAFAQCATKYIYILLHSLPSLGVWEKVQQTKTRFLFGGGHHSCPSQQSPHRFKI